MKFLSIFSLLTLASASALGSDLGKETHDLLVRERMSVNPEVQLATLEERDLEKRACKSNGCKCQKVPQGQYCGLCWRGNDFVVTKLGSGGAWNHVYECNKNGGCCDYGYAKDCDLQKTSIRC
ncbi:hypothetical protein jhhlp_004806 [Lomentospora prolificans]|uniref:Uncharacterized protein n=1 Tax=Lomentospora prolificans TaxID=41688 RepID=A0A2N3N8H6_9PEZI|nr:hypothetical protein jhhlp_004806 [Lomentospora prolificans]